MRWLRPAFPYEWAAWLWLGAVAVGGICLRFASPLPWELGHGLAILLILSAWFALALLYPLSRSNCCHPAARVEYLRWLRTTPWQPSDNLPLGPIFPAWQDLAALVLGGAALAVAVGLRAPQGHSPMRAETFFLAAFIAVTIADAWALLYGLFTLQVALALRKDRIALGLAIWFTGWTHFGLWVLGLENSWLFLGSMVGFPLVGIACFFAHRHWLGPSSWTDMEHFAPVEGDDSAPFAMDKVAKARFHWSAFDSIEDGPRISTPHALAFSTLSVWWYYFLLSDPLRKARVRHPVSGNAEDLDFWIVTIALLILCAMRLALYVACNRPPLSFFGRIALGQPIIPAYDRVLVTPLAGAALALVLPSAFLRAGLGGLAALSLTILAVLWVLLLGGPTLRNWRLTGMHHHRPIKRRDTIQV